MAHLLLLPLRYNFYQRKSEKLAVASQSAGIPVAFYSKSVSKPAATPALRFLQRKSEKLAVASQSAGIPAALHGTSGSKPAATIFAGKKVETAKDILNRKSLLLAHLHLLPGYDFYERKSEKLAVRSQSAEIPAAGTPAVGLPATGTSTYNAAPALQFLRAEKRRTGRRVSICW